jgi:DCN1-like protein 3
VKSDSITGSAGAGTTNLTTTKETANPKMEKKSLALKLSGTLNRNNSESRHISETKICSMFDKYKDSSEDSILAEGVEQFCIDLQLKPEEFKVLVLAWKFEAEVMSRFTRQEFIQGCKAMNVDSIKGIQNKLPEFVTQTVNDPELFKDLYRFTFKFGLDTLSGQRILPVDMAVSLWALVFSQSEPPILKRWIHFLDKHPQVRGIPRDTWNMFLNFVETVGTDLSHYDDTEAWPSLFDDFVEFENDQLNQNSSTMQDLNNQAVDINHASSQP